jgi:hypothetical protein
MLALRLAVSPLLSRHDIADCDVLSSLPDITTEALRARTCRVRGRKPAAHGE